MAPQQAAQQRTTPHDIAHDTAVQQCNPTTMAGLDSRTTTTTATTSTATASASFQMLGLRWRLSSPRETSSVPHPFG
eukprot:gene9311-biopygen349